MENSHKSNYGTSFFIDFFHKGRADKQLFKKIDSAEEDVSSSGGSSSGKSSSDGNSNSIGSSILQMFW